MNNLASHQWEWWTTNEFKFKLSLNYTWEHHQGQIIPKYLRTIHPIQQVYSNKTKSHHCSNFKNQIQKIMKMS